MVTLIGMGSGKWAALSAQAQQAVRSAGLVFGAKRLLACLPADCTARQFALYQPADILETLAQNPGQDAAVLYSGDTGFYSGASGLLTPLRALGIPARVYPGVSSIQMLSAALGRPWQDWKLVSAHGCACDPVAECMMNRSVFFLTGGTETPATLCKKLADAGMGEAHALVGENLGTEAEAIRYGSAAELAGQSFAPLSVLLVENFDRPQLRTQGWPDEAFIRGEVPMTKQEVRAAALAKLAVRPTDTVWDVGAGTGSVSVELALAAPKGRVYAVECEPDACELIRQNRAKFRTYNLTLIEGRAPDALAALPAPDAVFIGGTKGGMEAVLDTVLSKNPDARICISAIALETLSAAIAALTARGLTAEVVQIAVSRTKPAGRLHLLMANNPIFLITGYTQMMQFLIAAPCSGSGKTTVTCAVLAALKKRGDAPCAFKSGPDYIDPMFHRSALQVDSHNLDLFLSDRPTVQALYTRYAAGHGAAVCEGAMGFYDGQGLTTRASAWELADTLNLPVLLVVQPKGASVTLAAQIQGLVHFRKNSHIAGILLNDCSEKLYKMLKALLEAETGLPVLGYLPHLPQAVVESRHLGLKTAGEIADLQERIALLANALVMDWGRLEELTRKPGPEVVPAPDAASASVRIAVARDEAFCFTYAETLDALRDAGAELVFFSPVHDTALPESVCGLYLPGGYPELYAQALSRNRTMLASIRQAVNAGLPTAAECGGFLYLGQSLEDADGQSFPMAGVLPGAGIKVGRLVRFGYAGLTAKADSMLFCAGETLPIHEFHHWDSTENGVAFTACKNAKMQWECGFANEHFYAGFPHLYWAGTPLPGRFVRAAERYSKIKG